MFSRVSRYRDLPDVVTLDARGRAVRSRSLRLLPTAEGVLAHTVEEGDRLDHLAGRYYGQPRSWWRIADANPGFLSPDDLLGAGPRSTVVVPLEWEGPAPPPWSRLLRALRDTPGVEDAATGTAATGEPAVEVVEGPFAFALDPALAAELDASLRAQQLTPALLTALRDAGAEFSDHVRLEKPGPAAWHVVDLATGLARTARLLAGPALHLHGGVLLHRWAVEVAFNRLLLAPTAAAGRASVAGVAEGLGFTVGLPREARRIGAAIAVPPRPA
jgi:phage tail protein X